MRDLLWRVCFRRKCVPRQVTGDTTYGTIENIVALEDAGIRAVLPAARLRPAHAPSSGATVHLRCRGATSTAVPQPDVALPQAQAHRARPDLPSVGRRLQYVRTEGAMHRQPRAADQERSFDEAYLDRVRGYHAIAAYPKAMRKRQVWVEPSSPKRRTGMGCAGSGSAGCGTLIARAADRGRAEPEALAGRDGVGATPVSKWSGRGRPLGPPAPASSGALTAAHRPDRFGRLHRPALPRPFFQQAASFPAPPRCWTD